MKRREKLKSLIGQKVTLHVKNYENIEDVELVVVGPDYIEIYDEDNEMTKILKYRDIDICEFEEKKVAEDDDDDNGDDSEENDDDKEDDEDD